MYGYQRRGRFVANPLAVLCFYLCPPNLRFPPPMIVFLGVSKRSLGKDSRLCDQLKNAFFGFLALIDFPFEFRCWM